MPGGDKSSQSKPMEPQKIPDENRGRKRPRRLLVDAAVERVVLNVEDGSAGLRREYPLVDAAKVPTKGEKTESKDEKAEPEKPGSMESVSDSEDGVADVPDHIEEPDLEQELLRAAGRE